MRSLESLPEDILLSILQFSDLQEIFALSSTCRLLYLSSLQRSLWIGALSRTCAVTPLFCPTYEDLTAHSVKSLRNIAKRTLRRNRNWSLPVSEIVGEINSIPLIVENTRLDVVVQIPGTSLFLLHIFGAGELVCWDVGLKKAVSAPLEIGNVWIQEMFAGEGDCDGYHVALLLQPYDVDECAFLLVVEVSYGRKVDTVNLHATFKHVFPPNDFRRWAVFIHDSIVGLLQADFSAQGSALEVFVFNRSLPKMVHITTDISVSRFTAKEPLLIFSQIQDIHRSEHSLTSTFNDDLFILVEGHYGSYRYCCPKLDLPYSWNLDCSIESVVSLDKQICQEWHVDLEELEDVTYSHVNSLSANSSYGVLAASLRSIRTRRGGNLHNTLNATFWTLDEPETTMLVPKGQINIPGLLEPNDSHSCPWQLMHLAQSGLLLLLMVRIVDELPTLQLVRHDPQKGRSSIHQLKVPSVIDLGGVQLLSVDGHTGAVALVDREYVLHVIPFA